MPRTAFEVSHGVVEYPFPLSNGEFASLLLPERMTREDVERLVAYVNTLACEQLDELDA